MFAYHRLGDTQANDVNDCICLLLSCQFGVIGKVCHCVNAAIPHLSDISANACVTVVLLGEAVAVHTKAQRLIAVYNIKHLAGIGSVVREGV